MFSELPYRAHFRPLSAGGQSQTGPSAAPIGTTRLIGGPARARDPSAMTKRVVAAFLWFYTGWYAGAMIAAFLGINPAFGPILGVAAAGLVIVDPRQLFWARPTAAAAAPAPASVERAPEAA